MLERELLTAEELAARLRLRPSTVRRWARRRRIPAIRISPKVVRFDPSTVIDALAGRTKGDAHAR